MTKNSEQVADRRRALKRLIVEYMGGSCKRCGWSEDDSGLVPHHVDPSKKLFTLSNSGKTVKWETLKKECDKCILLCLNCHSVIHKKHEEFFFDEKNIPKYEDIEDVLKYKRRVNNYCLDCSEQIGYYSKRCKSCSGKINATKRDRVNKIEWPNLNELLLMIDMHGFKQCGKILGVSDNAIRKRIKKLSTVADVGLSA